MAHGSEEGGGGAEPLQWPENLAGAHGPRVVYTKERARVAVVTPSAIASAPGGGGLTDGSLLSSLE